MLAVRRGSFLVRRTLSTQAGETPILTKVGFAKDKEHGEEARTKGEKEGPPAAGVKASKVADDRLLYDGVYRSADDDITSDKISRRAGTPDATRVAFAVHAYGKDANLPSFAGEAVSLSRKMGRKAAPSGPTSKVVDHRALFDSDYVSSAADGAKTSAEIRRDVKADTPDATRVAFAVHAYGKDHSAPAFAAEAEALSKTMTRKTQHDVAKVVDDRSLFDSDYGAAAADDKTSDKIRRDVKADTPDETRVAFAVHAYGKDDSAPSFAGEAEALSKKVGRRPKPSSPSSKIVDHRSMFDSVYGSSAADGAKTSAEIRRDVRSDTPDETRVAFAVHAYGKDDSMPAFAGEAESLTQKVGRKQKKMGRAAAAPASKATDHRALFDSDYGTVAHDDKTSDKIRRDVRSDTPDETRVAFAVHTYGKDASAPAFAREAEALSKKVGREPKAHAPVPKIVHDRSMFDSVYGSSAADDDKTSDKIRRDVRSDTPDETRVAFAVNTYGKDISAPTFAGDAEALSKKAGRKAKHSGPTSKVTDHRALFDSDYGAAAADDKTSDKIRRQVSADTPDETRVAFAVHAYGKDASMPAFAGDAEAIAKRATRKPKPDAPVPKVVHDRVMFDSVYGASTADDDKTFDKVRRDVRSGTPDETRVAFAVHTYGKDASAPTFAGDAEALSKRASRKPRPDAPVPKVVDHRALFDSDYGTGATDGKTSDKIRRRVRADTPAHTRLSFFQSVYGEDYFCEDRAGHAEAVRVDAGPAPAAAPVRVSKIHDTKRAFLEHDF